jgi:hypothetical protein
LELRREGIAGVCGVCGEICFPGEEAVEVEVPVTIGGTLASCRLDDVVEDRLRKREDDMESDNAALESRIRRKRFKAAEVRRVAASTAAAFTGLSRSFLVSSILRKSEMFSSSACKESALVPVPSARIPDPGWAFDEAVLPLPLELLSSSVLMGPPEDNLPRRWLNELLYLEIGAPLGEADVEDGLACSAVVSKVFRWPMEGTIGGVFLAAAEAPMESGPVTPTRGEALKGVSTSDGEADNGGALKG